MPKISVIVPVYNTEKYLHRCIDSILAQTFTDFELLLIDDGSTDDSGDICDEYASLDKRIKVFHKENGGASSARNLGLDNACGNYLIFLDSDDFWIDNLFINVFHNLASKNNLDIVRGEYRAIKENGETLWNRETSRERLLYADKTLCNTDFLKYAVNGEFFLPLCLFKRSLFSELRFEDGRMFLEDMLTLSTVLLVDVRCMYLPQYRFYAYRKRTQSASNIQSIKKYSDSFSMCYEFHEIMQKAKNKKLATYYHNYSIMMYYWTLATVASDFPYNRISEIVNELKIKELHHDIRKWIRTGTLMFYNPFFYISPTIGTYLLKMKACFMAIFHKILSYRK